MEPGFEFGNFKAQLKIRILNCIFWLNSSCSGVKDWDFVVGMSSGG
jgi:hypothetical protein